LNEGDLPGPTAGVIGLVRDTLVAVSMVRSAMPVGVFGALSLLSKLRPGFGRRHAQNIKRDEAAAFGYPRER
jgi:hypothetical protein